MASASLYEPRRRARRRALQALYTWQINPQDAGDVIAQYLEEQDFSVVDAVFFEDLVRGVIRDHSDLDQRLAEFLDRPGEHLDVMERAILWLAAWELLNRAETPFQVVLDEATELAQRFGAEQGYSFVNGVLDRAARQWRTPENSGEAGTGG
jgi:N utilization substance protein B